MPPITSGNAPQAAQLLMVHQQVVPEARGIGAGRSLIEAVYAAADANGTPLVYWLTQEFNTSARQLYDRIAKVTPFIKYQR